MSPCSGVLSSFSGCLLGSVLCSMHVFVFHFLDQVAIDWHKWLVVLATYIYLWHIEMLIRLVIELARKYGRQSG